MFTSEVEHFLKLLPGHEDVCVEEGVSAHLTGELLHVSECLYGIKPEKGNSICLNWSTKQVLIHCD